MNDILVGNVCSLAAMVSDSVSSTRKKNGEVLGVQIISQVFYGAGSIILKGYSSTVQNAVAIARNLVAIKKIKSRAVEWTLIILGVALGIYFNNRGAMGFLPVAANFEYSVAVFRFKDKVSLLKAAFLVNAVMYLVFNFVIKNYVGAAANVVVIITTAVALIKDRKNKKGASPTEEK